MQKNNADLGILEFSYGFYDGRTQNADSLKTELETKELVQKYEKAKYFDINNITKMTSFGCVKVYSGNIFKNSLLLKKIKNILTLFIWEYFLVIN